MATALPAEFAQWVANTVYTPTNIERANDYLTTQRRLDPTKLRFPWTLTDGNTAPFEAFRQWRNPWLFTQSLFIPIPDLADPTGRTLAGFDVRYCGDHAQRVRFYKVKGPTQSLLYNVHEVIASEDPYVIVTESAMDTESVRQLGFNALSPLTALGSARFATFLYALCPRVYLMYDNDQNGQTQAAKILTTAAQVGGPVGAAFKLLAYRAGDPNKALQMFGPDQLRDDLVRELAPDFT